MSSLSSNCVSNATIAQGADPRRQASFADPVPAELIPRTASVVSSGSRPPGRSMRRSPGATPVSPTDCASPLPLCDAAAAPPEDWSRPVRSLSGCSSRSRQHSRMHPDDFGPRSRQVSQLGAGPQGAVAAFPVTGWFAKQARKWPHNFHRRFYEITPGTMQYWQSEADFRKDRPPVGRLEVTQMIVRVEDDSQTVTLSGPFLPHTAGRREMRIRIPRGPEGVTLVRSLERAATECSDVPDRSVGQVEDLGDTPLRFMIVFDVDDDDAPRHASALSYCRVLAQPGDVAAFYGHVHRVKKGPMGAVRSVLGLKTREEAQKELSQLVHAAASDGGRPFSGGASTHIDASDVGQEAAVVAFARDCEADIVAINRRQKHSSVKALVNALVHARAVLYTPCQFKGCSVLGSGRIQFLLVFDGSKEAGRAANALARLARPIDRVLVFTPFNLASLASGIYSDDKRVQKLEQRKEQQAEEIVREGAAIVDEGSRLAPGALDLQTRDVSALRGVKDLLKDEDLCVNCVVVGSHLQDSFKGEAKALLKHVVFGDVVEWLIKDCPVATLIVP